MTSRPLTPLLSKETRALLPTAVAASIAMLMNLVPQHSWKIGDLTMLAYVFGSLALGAQSIGHEYTYRTLGSLLAQPSDRRRLWLAKVSVLAVMLLWITATMWKIPSNRHDFDAAWSWYAPQMLFLSALFIAPWLTMLCRSSLAGMIFTGALFWLFWGASAVFLIATVGVNSRTGHDSVLMAVRMMLGLCAIAAVLGWRLFVRLEAIDARGAALTLPSWLLRTASTSAFAVAGRAQHPVWMLVKKELHLQQMTFVIVVLYVLCWAAAGLMDRFVPGFPVDFPLFPITILYFALLSIVIGSMASAEERQFGTLEWQVLLPMAMWRQWMVKVAVVIGLALVLGVGLPIALSYAHVSEDVRGQAVSLWTDRMFVLRMATIVVVLTTCGLYLSSLSTTGIQALVLSIPIAFIGGTVLPYAADLAARIGYGLIWDSTGRRLDGSFNDRSSLMTFVGGYLWLAVALGLVVLLLRFALQNHRSAERSIARLLAQVVSIAGYVGISVLLLAGLQAFFRTRFY